ncbi:unnamed protein product, partial [Ectocarpus sp. 6 AP-2014]
GPERKRYTPLVQSWYFTTQAETRPSGTEKDSAAVPESTATAIRLSITPGSRKARQTTWMCFQQLPCLRKIRTLTNFARTNQELTGAIFARYESRLATTCTSPEDWLHPIHSSPPTQLDQYGH